jgi:PAS domain S-box-containing protein
LKKIEKTQVKIMSEKPTYDEELEQRIQELEQAESKQKRAEEALRESEIKYRTILETTSEGCWILNPELETIEVNESFCKMLGYHRDEILGKTPFDFVDDENRKIFIGQTSKISTINHRSYEITLKKKNGENIHTFFNATTIKEASGKVQSAFAFITDITERKRMVDGLRESEEKYRLHFENVFDIIYSLDSEFRVLTVSPSVERILGYRPEELIGKPFQDLNILAPDYLEAAYNDVLDVFAGETITSVIYEFMAKDGTKKIAEVSGSPVFKDNKVVSIISVARDISQRKKAEEALKESEKKYRSMMEAMTDPAYICSHDFRIEYMNSVMIDKVGHDATGELCHKAIYDEDKKCPWCVFDQVRQGKHSIYEKKDPKTGRFYSINCSFVARSDAPASMLSIYRDITEIKMMEKERVAAEAKLQQALKMESIGTLAGGIAHDFNNILSSVIGYTELALDDIEKGSHLEDNLQEVYTAGLRAKDLVKQILTFARQTVEELKPVRVDIIAKEALKLLRSSLPTTIEIRRDIESDSLVMADPTQVHQILMNLCTNAGHAMEEKGGVLSIDLTDVRLDADFTKSHLDLKPGDYLKLSVSDTGSGIPPQVMESLFEPFFTTKEPGKGTGLGLSTVYGIVKNYGGVITVDSELGKGSIFNVYFPISKKRTEAIPLKAEALPTGTERILFIDDEAPIAKMGSQILEHLGYSVTARTSSVEALELFRSKPNNFDLVITDMTMPNMGGDKLAIELMKIRSDIPVIICTGYNKKISEETALEIGIKAFAYKPIVKADLAKTVRKVLDADRSKA